MYTAYESVRHTAYESLSIDSRTGQLYSTPVSTTTTTTTTLQHRPPVQIKNR